MAKKSKKSLKILLLTLLGLALLLVFIAIAYYLSIDTNLDGYLSNLRESSVTRIYYYDFIDRENRIGVPVELKDEELFIQKSEWISINDMPKNLINAFIAVEDKRFYNHSGVDWLRTSKAILNYVFKFDKSSFGGSTITQQLVKNLTGENETSAKRKLQEIKRALSLEKKLTKEEILEIYLNVVYLSENCYGVNCASQVFFNKDIGELSLLECASLASIVKSPSKYNPYANYDNNRKRSETVLNLMLEQGYISEEEYEDATRDNLVINKNIDNESKTGVYSWYTESLIDDVSDDLAKKLDITKDSARGIIMRGGINIYSLIDPRVQKECEKAYNEYKKYLNMQNGEYPQSSCVVLDPKTSDILAIIGSVGEKSGNLILNRAKNTKRPPGSVLKPLSVYSPSIDLNKITFSTVFDDTPILQKDGTYWPKNSPEKYRGLVPISQAVERSLNTVSVKALHELGIKNSLNYLDRFKINYTDNDKNDSSLALGQLTNGESLLNITNAYCSFANDGIMSLPKTYLYVTDLSGNIILDNSKTEKIQVVSKDTAFIVTKLLENVVTKGTAKMINFRKDISLSGKTGTSSNNEDKWFIGYTPYYTCGVWTGYDIPKPIYSKLNPSCLIFNSIMNNVHKDAISADFICPNTVIEQEFCVDSGQLSSEICNKDLRGNRTEIGYFKLGSEPLDYCNRHIEVVVDKDTEYIPNKKLPFWRRKRIALIDYERENFNNISVLDEEFLLKNRKEQ